MTDTETRLTDPERSAVCSALIYTLMRQGCAAPVEVTSALAKLSGVDAVVTVRKLQGGPQ